MLKCSNIIPEQIKRLFSKGTLFQPQMDQHGQHFRGYLGFPLFKFAATHKFQHMSATTSGYHMMIKDEAKTLKCKPNLCASTSDGLVPPFRFKVSPESSFSSVVHHNVSRTKSLDDIYWEHPIRDPCALSDGVSWTNLLYVTISLGNP